MNSLIVIEDKLENYMKYYNKKEEINVWEE